MIIVTGGAGFIGSNLVRALNARGETDVLVVDNLTDGAKFANLADLDIADYMDKDDFAAALEAGASFDGLRAVFHQGACSTTTEWDGRYMMRNNYQYSKQLLSFCRRAGIPFIYASSAAVYGAGPGFSEQPEHERPLNVYGYSKHLFDRYVGRLPANPGCQVVGLRYFNVYGPREQHKAAQASVAFHFNKQVAQTGVAKLFQASGGYDNGEQRRDFVYVGDVVDVNLWFLEHPQVSGIFNVGTGRSQSFNEVASAVIDWHGDGQIEYVAFPDHLIGRYQSYTQADITQLREAGCQLPFKTVEQGVTAYLDELRDGVE